MSFAAFDRLSKELLTEERQYLVNNKGESIPFESLRSKTVLLYFSAHWCPPCKRFTPLLAKSYEDLNAQGKEVEVVFISSDRDEESWKEYFGTMPWLALPWSERDLKDKLSETYQVNGIPSLVAFSETGEPETDKVRHIFKLGAKAYPFTESHIEKLLDEEKNAKNATQSFASLLATADRDYLVNNDGEQIKISSLEGKVVGLYFSASWCGPCRFFSPVLKKVYKELNEQGKGFEVVFISSDEGDEEFKEYYKDMPWLALPYADRELQTKLGEYFEVRGIPSLVFLDENGKTIDNDGTSIIRRFGADAYPFTSDKVNQLKKAQADIKAALKANQSLSSLLTTDTRDYLVDNKGTKTTVAEALNGKTVLLYFSGKWCGPCLGFTPKLVEAYQKWREEGKQVEVVFVSSDHSQEDFNEYLEKMPWSALPYEDRSSKNTLTDFFEVQGIPTVVVLDSEGKTVNKDAFELVNQYGARSLPLTEERLTELRDEDNVRFAKLPQEYTSDLHEHTLQLRAKVYSGRYGCDVCASVGSGYAYHCDECGWDAHPQCVHKEESSPPTA